MTATRYATAPAIGRIERQAALHEALQRAIPAGALWLRLLDREGIAAGPEAVGAVAERYGADRDELQACWEEELVALVAAAHERAGGEPGGTPDPRLVALLTIRDGPRLALLVVPDAAFVAALRTVRIDVARRGRSCLPGRLLDGVGGVLRRVA